LVFRIIREIIKVIEYTVPNTWELGGGRENSPPIG
jgi:hypothetical protein